MIRKPEFPITEYEYEIIYDTKYGGEGFSIRKTFSNLDDLYKFVGKPKDIYKKGEYRYSIYAINYTDGTSKMFFYIHHEVKPGDWDEIEEYYDPQVAYANRMCSYDGNSANYGVYLDGWAGQSR